MPAACIVSGVGSVFNVSTLVWRFALLDSTASICEENSDPASALTSARSASMAGSWRSTSLGELGAVERELLHLLD